MSEKKKKKVSNDSTASNTTKTTTAGHTLEDPRTKPRATTCLPVTEVQVNLYMIMNTCRNKFLNNAVNIVKLKNKSPVPNTRRTTCYFRKNGRRRDMPTVLFPDSLVTNLKGYKMHK